MALSISNVAPVEPTQDQLAARLNPQPTTTYTPSQGLFRGVGDYGTTLYSGSGKSLNLLDASLGLYDPSIVGAGAQSAAALQTLKNKYGFDYNSLPTVNIGDYIQQQSRAGTNPAGFKFTNGGINDFFTANAPALAPATISSQTTPAAPQGTPGTVPVPQGAAQIGAPAVALPNDGGSPPVPQTTTVSPATTQTVAGTISPTTTPAVGQQTPAQIAATVAATGQQPVPQSAPAIAPAQALPNNGSTSTTSSGVQGLIQPPPINTSQNTTNSTFPGLVSATAQSALGNTPIGQQATTIAQKYADLINPILRGSINQQIGDRSTGTTPVGEGNAQLAASAAGNLIQGLTSQESQELGAIGQQLTAQNQQTTGLQGAAGLAQPSANFPFVFNPLTGTYANQSTGATMSAADAAKAVLNYSMSYDQAKSGLGYLGTTAETQLQSAILGQNPNANINALQAQGAAQQSNVATGVTAPTTAANTVYQQAYNDYQNLQQSVSNVDQFGTTLLNGMVDKNTGQTINPSDVNWANKTLADVRSALSSSQQGQFDTTFAALKSKVSGLLSVGGDQIPTQITSDANKILSGSAPLSTLSAVLQRIQTEGNILLQNQANKVNQALTATQGGSSGGGAGTTSAGGYNYVLKNGQWVLSQ